MKRNERTSDPVVGILAALQGLQAGMWTALPGIVTEFDAAHMTISAQPQMQAKVTNERGDATWIDLPLLVDVPVIFPSGGGYTLTFPVKPNDECLLVFASRAMDTWWDQGPKSKGNLSPNRDLRMHDLSDAFAILGPRSRPKAIPALASNGVELRNEAGTTTVAIRDSGNIELTTPASVVVTAAAAQVNANSVSINAGSVIELTASVVSVIGPLSVTGSIQASGAIIDGLGKSLGTHQHMAGPTTTTPPI